MIRSATVAMAGFFLGCAGARPSVQEANPGGDGRTIETALHACSAGERTDYPMVANYVCEDGSRPLGGDSARGAAARVGNVGEGPEGHIIDHYMVPCPSGPVDLYVDAYRCPEGVRTPVDMSNLTPEQLAQMADSGRWLESAPSGQRAEQMRAGLLEFLAQTAPVHVEICPSFFEFLPDDAYPFAVLMREQFVVSLAAGVIETSSEPQDRLRNSALALVGVARLYTALLQESGQVAANTTLDRLRETASSEDSLVAQTQALLDQCSPSPTPGFTMERNGQNVWPPEGPGCEALIRCCESNGLVQNGAAVSGQPGGMQCLLAATAGCAVGMTMLQESGIRCDP